MRHLALLALALTFLPQIGAGQSGPSYTIGPKDLLEIRVFEDQSFNGEYRVSEAGLIGLPRVGNLPVEGRTADEIEVRLKELLEERFFRRATVSVQVIEFRSKPISVLGAVKTPGDLAFSGRWTLLEALTAAGGLTASHGDIIYVLRRANNGLSDQVEISVKDLLERADPTVNIPIFANDLINIPETVNVTVYCMGEVATPGAYEFKSTERISLLAAIARAGGLGDRASSKIKIKRTDSRTGQERELEVDYDRIVDGKDPDLGLQEGDIVVVKESFF